ncbi:MAG: hypothetical protein M1834_007087 [Cirrosporium novae-zelandiae]|nr:MAG: hypothetical protein M1834_007087 [Cirrosporium novae-zelandiae]
MNSNKDRLYIALHARGGAPKMPGLEDTYHWAFIVGPKIEPDEGERGTRFDVRNRMSLDAQSLQSTWEYEERKITLEPTAMLLVRILIGKVKNMKRLKSVLEATPVRAGQPGYDHWNCVEWIKEALDRLTQDEKALGTSATDWDIVRDTAMWYSNKKKREHRFDGQGGYDPKKVPTWSMLDKVELVP